MKLKLIVNNDKINELGQKVIAEKSMPISSLVTKHGWLVAVEMPSGKKVAAYSGSSLKPLSTPYFYITDKGADTHVHNKAPVPTIVKKLSIHCKDPTLPEAVKYLKRAIMAIS